ncbi:MAG TPA: hypothetical protein VHA37_04570 [Candidatus Saccharimonadales bacterium]|nr:hypothetical protein [Candidatus Saccharimonadales bacterium]
MKEHPKNKTPSTSPERGPEMVFAELARELTEFCLQRGKECFKGWPVPTVFKYVFFHLATRSCVFLRMNGKPAAVMFARGVPAKTIEERAAKGEPVFSWSLPQDNADALFVAEVIATDETLPALVKRARARWPNWQSRKMYTFRHGKLVQFSEAVKEKFLTYGRR